MRRTPALALAATTLLLTAACSSAEQPSAGATSAPPASATPVAEAVEPPTLEECVVGTWEQDMDAMSEQFEAMFAPLAAETDGLDISFDGTASAAFAKDGTVTSTTDSTIVMTSVIEGTELVMTMVSGGTTTGTWVVEDDTITVGDVDASGLTMDVSTTLDGVETEIPGMDEMANADSLVGQLPPAAAAVECTDDELVMTTEMPDASMAPAVQRYTR
ncbi:hypothetical protein [Cellulomonas sp. SLBN-39]|uniref:hypothetical protein n=1 Tax=Cellulomonas sp. SLBN-39 TaxID=2768446 RepID=UPI00114F1E09|nr:hypothetical protein [Cellulomonas sp. SLBN-39]TQL03253.1 hypothetical protein FBY24_2347 [Cellulomonas sp. SLBN-39]